MSHTFCALRVQQQQQNVRQADHVVSTGISVHLYKACLKVIEGALCYGTIYTKRHHGYTHRLPFNTSESRDII
jgi:hypothetical protein